MKKANLGAFNNEWYQSGGSSLKKVLWYFANLLFIKNGFIPISSLKVQIIRYFGGKIGRGVVIKPGVSIKYPWKLKIGNNVWIGENVWIDNLDEVTIENNVCVSQGAMLLTGSHNYKKETFDLIIGEIILEEGVWIGAKSVVCPGVTCFSHSILSVSSVANRDLKAYTIYQGNPAVEKRKRVFE